MVETSRRETPFSPIKNLKQGSRSLPTIQGPGWQLEAPGDAAPDPTLSLEQGGPGGMDPSPVSHPKTPGPSWQPSLTSIQCCLDPWASGETGWCLPLPKVSLESKPKFPARAMTVSPAMPMGSRIAEGCPGHPGVSGQGRGAPEPSTAPWRSEGYNTDPSWRWRMAIYCLGFTQKLGHLVPFPWGKAKRSWWSCRAKRHCCPAEEEQAPDISQSSEEAYLWEEGTCWKHLKGE